jgi:hypothetical protein
MPLLAKIGVAISDTLSIENARPMGEQKCTSLPSRMPRCRSSASMRNDTSSGAGGHLYGIPAMAMTIRPPVNASSARRRSSAASAE